MDCTKQTEGSCQYYPTKKQYRQFEAHEIESDQLSLQEVIKVDLNNMPDKFYKSCYKSTSGQKFIKHGHQAYSLYKSQEDLTFFCLSLLQFQALFPLRFFMVENKKKMDRDQPGKVVWFETQFLSLTNTTNLDSSTTMRLENQVYKFFIQILIPSIAKFKQEKMSWNFMISQEYTDEKVIQEFKEVIKRINDSFKATCQTL